MSVVACRFRRSILLCVALLVGAVPASAATYYVDNQNPVSTDSGTGTLAIPYRTISAAVAQRGTAGNTIIVRSGIYPEQVTLGASGTSTSPIVIRADGSVTLDGADSFATSAQWSLVAGDIWLARERDVDSGPGVRGRGPAHRVDRARPQSLPRARSATSPASDST